ncbi:GNAT family N-acetyltransferase [Microbacterium sorbitolivorans]|nr:GNAT family N-acetyltransferase [Microbacterium sorbitolivorans]
MPASADDESWRAYVALLNRAYERESGSALLPWDAAVMHSEYVTRTHRVIDGFVARRGGELVGAASLEYDLSTARDVQLAVSTDPADPSLFEALLAHAEGEARALGRTNAQIYISSPVDIDQHDDAEILRPPSGFGGVLRAAPLVQILLGRGYALGQVERCSVFRRGTDPAKLERRLHAASAVAGSDYVPVWWSGRTPDEYVDAYAYAVSRMSTDVPHGELSVEEQSWDAARVRAREARVEPTGELWAIAAVVHRPTGQIVAFNELVIPPDRTETTANYGTIALSNHRGHRLGTIVKCLGLLRWLDLAPSSPAVVTFNAVENRYMLDVNEAVGFTPLFWEGTWSRQL